MIPTEIRFESADLLVIRRDGVWKITAPDQPFTDQQMQFLSDCWRSFDKSRTRHVGRPATLLSKAKDWDWTKSDRELALEHGKGPSVVGTYRRRLAQPRVPSPGNPIRKAQERAAWDWSKTDIDLAREHNISRERVRQIRLEITKKSSPRAARRFEEFKRWIGDRKEITLKEGLLAGFNRESVRKYALAIGVNLVTKRKTRWPWHLVNWELGNTLIEEAWGMPVNVPASHRYHRGVKGGTIRSRSAREFSEEVKKANQWKKGKIK